MMGKFFDNIHAILLGGLVLTIAVMVGLHSDQVSAASVMRWLHLFFGVMWIGLLYYFNFVQTPTMPSIPADLKPAVSKHIAPAALFYFRWGAAFTVLTGIGIASHPSAGAPSYLVQALTLQEPYRLIGVGMWLAIIMAFNVWFIIWPAQKKALGIVTVDDAAKASAARTGLVFSRTNVLLSLPMFYCMVSANHG